MTKREKKATTKTILAGLKTRDNYVVADALEALKKYPDPLAAAAALKHAETYPRRVREALAQMELDVVLGLLESELTGHEISCVCQALSEIGDKSAIPALRGRLQSSTGNIVAQMACARGLWDLKWRAAPGSREHRLQLISAWKFEALRALGSAANDVLMEAVAGHHEDMLRDLAVSSLGQLGDPSVVPFLIETWQRDPRRRSFVAGALGDLRASDAVELLLTDLNKSTLPALVKIGDARAIDPLIALARGSQHNTRLRIQAMAALATWKDEERVVEAMTEHLTNEDLGIREAAARLLQSSMRMEALPLSERVTALVIAGDFETLRRMGGLAVVPHVGAALLSGVHPMEKQESVARFLGGLGEEAAVAPLLDWLFLPNTLIFSVQARLSWEKALEPTFGKRVREVLNASCVVVKTTRVVLEEERRYAEEYDHDLGVAEAATQKLAKLDDPLTNHLLRRIAEKKNTRVKTSLYTTEEYGGSTEQGNLSYAKQRAIARKALKGREKA